jgi:hypothetical protein
MPTSPYLDFAVSQAQRYGVPANLFTAQIGAESSWNPTAQNGNAYGIAQFMPATAADYGVNRSDPYSSITGAAQYDAQLFSQYGSWQTALQKYGTTANGNAPSVDALAASIDSNSPFSSFTNFFKNTPVATGLDAAAGAVKAVASVGDLLAIITDLPRMLSIIIGVVALAAGLYMLGSPTVVAAVQGIKSTAVKAAEVAAA